MKWKGLKEFEQFVMPIEDINLDPRNPRLHPERNIEDIARSLDNLGQHRLGVLSKDGWLIVGNGMLKAAEKLGWTHLAVVKSDDEENIARLRSIADNRTQETSQFDWPVLKDIMQEIDTGGLDIEITGFSIDTIIDFNINNEWKGMPEFNQEKEDIYKILIIRFEKEKDYMEFAKLIKQKLTDKTKSIWFPERDLDNLNRNFVYKDES